MVVGDDTSGKEVGKRWIAKISLPIGAVVVGHDGALNGIVGDTVDFAAGGTGNLGGVAF